MNQIINHIKEEIKVYFLRGVLPDAYNYLKLFYFLLISLLFQVTEMSVVVIINRMAEFLRMHAPYTCVYMPKHIPKVTIMNLQNMTYL